MKLGLGSGSGLGSGFGLGLWGWGSYGGGGSLLEDAQPLDGLRHWPLGHVLALYPAVGHLAKARLVRVGG